MTAFKETITLLCLVAKVVCVTSTMENFFASKTSYTYNANLDTSPMSMSGCQPQVFYMLARHGTRNPGDGGITEMQEYLPGLRNQVLDAFAEGKGELDEETITALINWSFDIDIEDEGALVEAGMAEHHDMGKRWSQRLSESDLLKKETTTVRSSPKPRCIESGQSFLEGADLSGIDVNIEDFLINFYDFCPRYIEDVLGSEETYAEMRKIMESTEWEEMLQRVNQRTGVTIDKTVNEVAWDMCRYERAWRPSENSPWCSLFSHQDLALYNFREDLKYYYEVGPAYPITSQITQPMIEDILQSLESETTSTILNFGHSDTLMPLMAALGLYHDDHDLVASDLGQDHLWDVSRIAGFSSNVALIVFGCEEGKMVSMYHQESPVIQPACGDYICSLDQLKAYYRDLANSDFNSTCAL